MNDSIKMQLREAGRKQHIRKLIAEGRTAKAKEYADRYNISLDTLGGAGVGGGQGVAKADHSTPIEFFPSKEAEANEASRAVDGVVRPGYKIITGEEMKEAQRAAMDGAMMASEITRFEAETVRRVFDVVPKDESGHHERETAACAFRLNVGPLSERGSGGGVSTVESSAEAREEKDRAKAEAIFQAGLRAAAIEYGAMREGSGVAEVAAEERPEFVRPLEALPMGVRWAEVKGHTRNLRLKVIKFCDGGNEALVWIGWKDLNRMGRSVGRLLAVVPNPDLEQGNYVIWRR